MPFTGSHPAAVLPLLRLGLPASALVIGSLTPDLPYYFDLPVTAAQTHSLTGALGADLILGISAYLIWHLLLVPPLIWAAPAGLQRRIPDRLRAGPRLSTAGDLARVGLALAIGALTHVLWDAFTHAGMLGPRMVPWLDSVVYGLPLFRWLHLGSSILGLACLGGSRSAGGPARPRPAPSPPSGRPSGGGWGWRCSLGRSWPPPSSRPRACWPRGGSRDSRCSSTRWSSSSPQWRWGSSARPLSGTWWSRSAGTGRIGTGSGSRTGNGTG